MQYGICREQGSHARDVYPHMMCRAWNSKGETRRRHKKQNKEKINNKLDSKERVQYKGKSHIQGLYKAYARPMQGL